MITCPYCEFETDDTAELGKHCPKCLQGTLVLKQERLWPVSKSKYDTCLEQNNIDCPYQAIERKVSQRI